LNAATVELVAVDVGALPGVLVRKTFPECVFVRFDVDRMSGVETEEERVGVDPKRGGVGVDREEERVAVAKKGGALVPSLSMLPPSPNGVLSDPCTRGVLIAGSVPR